MYMCPIQNSFQDRAISLHSSSDLVPNNVLPSHANQREATVYRRDC
jgi:hypothetical protein